MRGPTIRFLADANLRETIIKGLLRMQPNVDFLSAKVLNLTGVPDPEVLAIAANEGRILVTHDVHTMPQHFGEFLAAGNHSAGVILVPQNNALKPVLETLLLIWNASDPADWVDTIDRIPW